MTVYVLGFQNSKLYEETTALKIANHNGFEFRKGLRVEDKYSADDILIRYGNATYGSFEKKFGVVLNSYKTIRANTNKQRTHLLLWKKGVSVPKIFLSQKDVDSSELPVLRRNSYHSRAKDIRMITSIDNFIQGSFYTSFIPSDEEYRIHIMFGQCVRVSKKVPKSDNKDAETRDVVRSSTTGWTLVDIFKHNIPVEVEAIRECINAMKVVGLNFGAVDVIVHRETNKPYVLEVNSCPRLSYYGLSVYSKEIHEYLGIPIGDVKVGKVRRWEFKDTLPMKYRKTYKLKKERLLNTQGFV